MKYFPPEFKNTKFHCPNCGVYAKQDWGPCQYLLWNSYRPTGMMVALCSHCDELSYWYRGTMIVPSTGTVELPSQDLPKDCRVDYEEARDIVNVSPRGAAALLRLCIQRLMPHLGKTGVNINNDIAELVKDGMPALIQKSLDICRVVGNNAVHPGEIDLNDTPEIAHNLFRLINIIVQNQITQPKEVEALYGSLPEGALSAIEKRDMK